MPCVHALLNPHHAKSKPECCVYLILRDLPECEDHSFWQSFPGC